MPYSLMKCLVFCLAALLGPVVAHAQAPLTADSAYNYLQHQRSLAQARAGKSSPDSLRAGVRILQDALAYYYRPAVVELARQSKYLYARKDDIRYDLAVLQARLNEPGAAATTLLAVLTPEQQGLYAPWIEQESALAATRREPTLQPALARALTQYNIFNSPALATPYQPNLSAAEKVAGLSKLWEMATYNFAYFDHLPGFNWDQRYLDYLPRVQATPSTLAYFRVLQEFYAQLHDGHTGLWVPAGPLADSVYGRPPLLTQLVAGRVLVRQVSSDSLRRTGLVPGLEITRLDGLPVVAYADRHVRPYQSGSTTQNVDVQTYTYNLLRGPVTRPVTVEFRDARGHSFTRRLPRRGYGKPAPYVPVRLRQLPGNVEYLQVNTFGSDAGFRRFAAAFDSLQASAALIIDLRQNGGGSSENGFKILRYLTNHAFRVGSYESRLYSAVGRARGEGVRFVPVDTASRVAPAGAGKYYAKPVVVLISGETFSAAEDFCAAYVGLKRGALVGEPTGGSTGQPLSFALPGGIMARVCTKRDAYPDGIEWNGIGIQPTLLVQPTVAALQAGRDPVLEAALRILGVPANLSKRATTNP